MKKTIIFSSVVILLGLLISLGPQFLFKVCPVNMASESTASSESMTMSENADDCCANPETSDCCADPETSSCCGPAISSLPICHWTGRAEIGIGFLIVALGACMIVFADIKTQLGLLIGVFFSSIIAIAVPHALIGGCSMATMRCHRVAFPALTIEGIALLVFSVILITIIAIKKEQ